MRSLALWRSGAVLLVAGGVLGAVGLLLADLVPGAWSAGAALLALGLLLDGLGIAAAGVGMGRRLPACVLLMVAGGLIALEAVSELVAGALVPVPGWLSLALAVAGDLVLLAAAVATVLRGRLPGVAGWVLVLPAGWLVLTEVAIRADPLLPLWWAALLVPVLFAVAGIAWVRVAEPTSAQLKSAEPTSAQPNVNEYAARPDESAIETVPSRAGAVDATV